MVEKTTITIRQEIDPHIWKYVRLYGVHKFVSREKALEDLISLGWQKLKELEDNENELPTNIR